MQLDAACRAHGDAQGSWVDKMRTLEQGYAHELQACQAAQREAADAHEAELQRVRGDAAGELRAVREQHDADMARLAESAAAEAKDITARLNAKV